MNPSMPVWMIWFGGCAFRHRRRTSRLESAFIASPSAGKRSLVVDPATLSSGADGRVVFAATVDLENLDSGEKVTYQIVGIDEADIKVSKVSVTSPIARALIGKSAGDVVAVEAPSGVREYEILEVRYV